jgi:hypothetical protein
MERTLAIPSQRKKGQHRRKGRVGREGGRTARHHLVHTPSRVPEVLPEAVKAGKKRGEKDQRAV